MAEATVPPKRRKTLLLVVGLVLLLVAIAAAAAFFLIRNKQLEAYSFGDGDPEQQAQAEQAKKAAEKKDTSKHVFSTLDMFTANLSDRDRDRFAQIGVIIEIKDAKADAALKAVVPPVRSDILLLLSAKNADELLTLDGKHKLAQQVLEIARTRIAAEYRRDVFAVHFSSFVIQ